MVPDSITKTGMCNCGLSVIDVNGHWEHVVTVYDAKPKSACPAEGVRTDIVSSLFSITPTGAWWEWIREGLNKNPSMIEYRKRTAKCGPELELGEFQGRILVMWLNGNGEYTFVLRQPIGAKFFSGYEDHVLTMTATQIELAYRTVRGLFATGGKDSVIDG